MTLATIMQDYAAALEIVRRVSDARYSDCVAAYTIDEDTVAMADLLLRDIKDSNEQG
jgi:hypothetical protein